MQIVERRIFVTDNAYKVYLKSTYPSNNGYHYPLNNGYPIHQKGKDINIDIRIDRLFNYYINKDEKILDFFNSKNELYEFYNWIERLEFDYTKESLTILSEDNIIKIKTIIYAIKDICQSNRKKCLNKSTRDKFIDVYDNCKNFQNSYENTENKINNFYDYYYASIIRKLE